MFYRPITDRLVLKLPTVLDAEEMFALIEANRDHLKTYMIWEKETATVEDERNYLTSANHFDPDKDISPFLLLDGHIIGAVGLPIITRPTKCGEIGYWISSEYEGKGYVTAAVRELEKMAFTELGLEKVQITNDVSNQRSRAVPERLGYHLDGILRRSIISGRDGDLADKSVYSILKQEWEAREGAAE